MLKPIDAYWARSPVAVSRGWGGRVGAPDSRVQHGDFPDDALGGTRGPRGKALLVHADEGGVVGGETAPHVCVGRCPRFDHICVQWVEEGGLPCVFAIAPLWEVRPVDTDGGEHETIAREPALGIFMVEHSILDSAAVEGDMLPGHGIIQPAERFERWIDPARIVERNAFNLASRPHEQFYHIDPADSLEYQVLDEHALVIVAFDAEVVRQTQRLQPGGDVPAERELQLHTEVQALVANDCIPRGGGVR